MIRTTSKLNRFGLTALTFAEACSIQGTPIIVPVDLPPITTNLLVRYDAASVSSLFQSDADELTPVTTDGQSIGRVHDLSGNNYHALQPTAAARPLYKTNIQNGKPAFYIDTNNKSFAPPSVTFGTGWTAYMVFRRLSATIPAFMGYAGGLIGQYGYDSGYNMSLSITGGNTERATLSPGVADYKAISVMASDLQWQLNGGSAISIPNYPLSTSYAVGIGYNTYAQVGYVFEVLFYSALHTTTERNTMRSWLNTKWAIY